MTLSEQSGGVSRRVALAGLGAVGAGLGILAGSGSTRAASVDMASHPMVGMWLSGRAPNDINVTYFGPDGVIMVSGNVAAVAQDGSINFMNLPFGVWEPTDEYGIHFTFSGATFDSTGAYTGTGEDNGFPVASEDGNSFWDDGKKVSLTFRDATGTVVQKIGGDGSVPGIGGVRMMVGDAGYDRMLAAMASRAATPTP